MRTTISIAEDLLAEAQRLTGRTGYSDAIVTSLRDYIALRQRLALLDRRYQRPVPHSRTAIKRARRERRWSS
jgi:Arc/MetJ family transcription regulator